MKEGSKKDDRGKKAVGRSNGLKCSKFDESYKNPKSKKLSEIQTLKKYKTTRGHIRIKSLKISDKEKRLKLRGEKHMFLHKDKDYIRFPARKKMLEQSLQSTVKKKKKKSP